MRSSSIETSARWTILGIVLLFALSIVAVIISPQLTERSWVTPASAYQRLMFELADPNVYLSPTDSHGEKMHTLYHLHAKSVPLAFIESEEEAIFAPPELQSYVTKVGEPIRLTRRLLLLRELRGAAMQEESEAARWLRTKEYTWKQQKEGVMPRYRALELYDPGVEATFSIADSDGLSENWVDPERYYWVDAGGALHGMVIPSAARRQLGCEDLEEGSIFARNPRQYRLSPYSTADGESAWRYQIGGERIDSMADLKERKMGALSRAYLIDLGEKMVAREGCNTCHTFQTRTLIQDIVHNGLEHPAPPSSPGEYVYERVSFMGTKRNGPDLSRVGIKRMSRDWHMSHFWSPKTASPGSIMPAYRHFFDFAPSGTPKNKTGIPNYRFEAIYQYLLTKGTRIDNPPQAWWRGGHPALRDLLEGRGKKR